VHRLSIFEGFGDRNSLSWMRGELSVYIKREHWGAAIGFALRTLRSSVSPPSLHCTDETKDFDSCTMCWTLHRLHMRFQGCELSTLPQPAAAYSSFSTTTQTEAN
jgi:hypothetical protein